MENNLSMVSDAYQSNREWLRTFVGGTDVVICFRAALECMELFSGYFGETEIDVYALEPGPHKNVRYHIVSDLSKIESVQFGILRCTTMSRTVNDMLEHDELLDEQALTEALSCYYYENGESFEGLHIKEENRELFEKYREWALDYYSEG